MDNTTLGLMFFVLRITTHPGGNPAEEERSSGLFLTFISFYFFFSDIFIYFKKEKKYAYSYTLFIAFLRVLFCIFFSSSSSLSLFTGVSYNMLSRKQYKNRKEKKKNGRIRYYPTPVKGECYKTSTSIIHNHRR